MRTLAVLVAAILAATNSGAQTPLTIDPTFQFYYGPDLMDHWSAIYAGGNGAWTPAVGDVLLRSDGSILATGNHLLKRLDEMPWGGQVSVVFAAQGDGSLLQYLPSCNSHVIEIPSSSQYFSNNNRKQDDCSLDHSFGMPDIYVNQRSQIGWHIFDDRSALSAGYFRITQSDPLRYVLIKVDQWGEWDSSWTPRYASRNGGADVQGKQLVKLSNGQFLFNGRWSHYEGRPTGTIVRINMDGSQDTTFNTIAWSSEMQTVHEQVDGKVVLGGMFLLSGIPDTLNLIRLNADGSLDYSFNNFNHVRTGYYGPVSVMGSGVSVVKQLDEGRLFIGGAFTRVDDAPRGCMACVDTAGNLLDCWVGGGLSPLNYTASGWPNVWLSGLKTLANGETYIYGTYKGITDANGYHPEQVCMSRLSMPDVGVVEQSGQGRRLRVWPNPGREALHLEWSGDHIDELEVRDALGRSVLKRISILNNKPIDVASLVPGSYIVLARTAHGERAVAKWVKQ